MGEPHKEQTTHQRQGYAKQNAQWQSPTVVEGCQGQKDKYQGQQIGGRARPSGGLLIGHSAPLQGFIAWQGGGGQLFEGLHCLVGGGSGAWGGVYGNGVVEVVLGDVLHAHRIPQRHKRRDGNALATSVDDLVARQVGLRASEFGGYLNVCLVELPEAVEVAHIVATEEGRNQRA